jgi:hypothetical protein
MASKNSHAAWQTEREFRGQSTSRAGEADRVRLRRRRLPRGGSSRDGVARAHRPEAHRNDTDRNRRIPRGRRGDGREYPPADRPPTLVDIFGFDPVRWVSAVQDFKALRRLPTPAPPLRVMGPRSPVPPPLQPHPEPQPALARVPTRPREAVPFLHSVWTDSVSRTCVIVGAFALWLTVSLVDASFLALLLPALTGLWWRRSHHGKASAKKAPADDDPL